MTSTADLELQHLRLALESAQLGTFEHDLASRFVRLSTRACQIYGIADCGEASLDEMLRHADPEGLVARQRALRVALEDEQHASYEVEYKLHPPQGTRWISVRGRVLFDDTPDRCDRRAVRVVGVVADVTRQKSDQLALENVSQMLNAVGESTNAFMYVKDRDSRMLYCNRAVLKAMRKSAGEVIGKSDLEFLGAGPTTEAILANDRAVIESGEPYIYSEHLEGIDRDYLSTKTPFRDGQGRVIGLAGVSLDVTELNQVREALEKSEERAAMAVEAAEIGIYEWDPLTDRGVWSDTMRAQFGLDLESVVTMETAGARIHPDDRERVGQAIVAAMDPYGGGRYDIEYRTVPVQGERWLHVLGRVQFADRAGVRTAVRFSGVTIDITRQKTLEHALRDADRRKDEFLAMLAHELRNPLAPMTYAADTLALRSDDPARVEQLAAVIARQTRHMTRLVDDLLDASRLTLGKVSLRNEPVRLLDVVTAAAESVLTPAIRAERTVNIDLASQPAWVSGDADRLTQMISNLLQNAVKFSRVGGHVGLRLEHSGHDALISVLDDGHGIAPQLLPTVFDLFVQGDNSLDRQSGGLGIGLSLVRALAELHGGSVIAHSEGLGLGARFSLRLPLVPEPEAAQTESASGASGVERILIVEDNVDAAETLQALLELQGHEVWVAHDGLTGLARALELAPSVMLVDIGLPGLNGLELARRLRAELKVQPRRLVALTGYGSPRDRADALEAGFDLHLVKPATFESLALALAEPGRTITPA
jgi:PAS domain S-box-containing protein